MTRLEAFRIANGIRPGELERESRVSRQFLLRVRLGQADPGRAKMLMIRDGCTRLLRRRIHLAEIFDLGEGVSIVTREHGNTFVREWFQHSIDDGTIAAACAATRVVPWPEDDDEPGQNRSHDITDEICERVLEAVRETVSDMFVSVAADVLNRERSRG